MRATETYPTLDVVSAIFAAINHQKEVAYKINPDYDISKAKPSDIIYVPTKPNTDSPGDFVHEGVSIPSLATYAKTTVGIADHWIHELSEVVIVTEQNTNDARAAMEAIQNKVMMMVLKGKKINGFIGNLSKLIEKPEVLARDFGLLSFIPNTAKQYVETEAVDSKKTEFMNSKALGAIGDKVSVRVSIFNSRVMAQYGSILYEGHDDDGNLISFFKSSESRDQYNCDYTYNIVGKIKMAVATPYSFGAIVNSLNYVRMVKNG